eukprot:1156151-Pelagomonas_calceolata.AAC.9
MLAHTCPCVPCTCKKQSCQPTSPPLHTQCFVKQDAPISNTTIRDIGFRSRFGAAVVAVMRERPLTLIDKLAGKFRQPKRERVEGRLGDIALQPGDELLLDIGEVICVICVVHMGSAAAWKRAVSNMGKCVSVEFGGQCTASRR